MSYRTASSFLQGRSTFFDAVAAKDSSELAWSRTVAFLKKYVS